MTRHHSIAPGADLTVPPVPKTDRAGSRLSALDGVRAFAVATVLAFHAGVSWVGGGLLGVDVFFVLSGFLITALLCDERARTGTVALTRFWARRARRLLPGLFVLLLGVALYAYLFAGSLDLASIRGDALATLTYVANWHFIFSDQGYFAAAAAPSPLLHTWSLAVEEQYYLVWPLVALLVFRRFGTRALAWVAGVGALASAVLMAAMYHAGFGIDRLYYGTDTRAQALLVGSFLGAVASRQSWRALPERVATTPAGRAAGAALAVLGGGFLLWAWHAEDGQEPFLYTGGFLLVSLAAAAVIAHVVTWRESPLSRFLSLGALTFVGRISYGLYLYHWPLFLAIDHAHTGLAGSRLLAVRLGATLAVATASFYLIEQPIRTRRPVSLWRSGALSGTAVAVTVGSLVVTTLTPAAASVVPPAASHALPAAERQRLATASAFTSDPVRFLLVGDSVALTLGIGLGSHSKRDYGVREYDGATLGCDLDPGLTTRISGSVVPATPGCNDWPAMWAKAIEAIRPQVVGIGLGRWEVTDHLYQGQWTHVGEPAWDAHLVADLDHAVTVASSLGAKVVLFTMPYVDPPQEAPNGSTFPENLPARADAFNALVRQVGRQYPGTVTVLDLNRYLDPAGHYTSAIDGTVVRWTDGIHISLAGGELVQPEILPVVASLGLSAPVAPPPAGPPATTGQVTGAGSGSS